MRLQYLEVFSPKMNKFLVEKYKFSIFAYEFSKVKLKIVNNTRNTKYLGQNTSKYCSRIIEGHVHANDFL